MPLGKRLLSTALLCATLPLAAQQTPTEHIAVDANAATTPFPHFWEHVFGSGRAHLALREPYRKDLEAVHEVTGFEYARFHGIFHDENGVYTEDIDGKPHYNWSTVDEIYDGLLKRHVRPLVELSFMPKALAYNPDALHAFWYKQNVSGPKSMARWNDFMRAFAQHMIERHGIDEVSQWYFEVWNEPNLDFWIGVPQQKTYFEFYANTAKTLKSVSPRLRVGGPATSSAHWIPEFIAYMNANHAPVDFVSTHGYADDSTEDYFDKTMDMPKDERVCKAIAKVHDQIKASAMPNVPLFWTEWSVQGQNNSRDTIFTGPGLANTIRQCDGFVDEMSWWTFSDVFEEGGPILHPMSGQFGIRGKWGINKPAFYDYALLHKLGEKRIASTSDDAIITRRADGSLVIAAWNIVDPDAANEKNEVDSEGRTKADAGIHGPEKTIELDLKGVAPNASLTIERVDATHGNVLPKFWAIGAPDYPTEAQVTKLNAETALPAPERAKLSNGKLTLKLTPNALVLVTIAPR
ncbi:glycosyl hydrolase family 39 [Granulicella cerasi]|uniref:Glycosyl hydrolase family 39 n=1 Tax=Granulicella cerasi TaxID=741063 RepID=A0ABW1Z6P6_9BACT|nr:glycosyl hydrolase family 39 [Granulicella cerasi]